MHNVTSLHLAQIGTLHSAQFASSLPPSGPASLGNGNHQEKALRDELGLLYLLKRAAGYGPRRTCNNSCTQQKSRQGLPEQGDDLLRRLVEPKHVLTSDRVPIPQLQLVWPERLLNAPPEARPAPGYSLRTYRPGDELRFLELMDLVGWPGWNDEKLRPWLYRMLPDGWIMAVHEESDMIVATAMATHDHTWTRPFCGELGWLAADPAHRGKGLGMAVSAAVTARFIEAGYRCIHLFTEHWRLAAIKIYLQLGYVPYLYSQEQPGMWREVCLKLEWPYSPDCWKS